jgi:hypothetical protein
MWLWNAEQVINPLRSKKQVSPPTAHNTTTPPQDTARPTTHDTMTPRSQVAERFLAMVKNNAEYILRRNPLHGGSLEAI